MDGPNWQLIATGAVGLLVALVAWIGGRTLTRLGEHIEDDSHRFAALGDKINAVHLDLRDRIAGRWSDRAP